MGARPLARRRLRAAALLGALALVAIALACRATAIVPPADPLEPRSVFVLDHGRHTSLVLPDGDGAWLRFAYGDWRYYAEGRTGFWRAATAALVPTRACLGRRSLPVAAADSAKDSIDAAAIQRAVRIGVEAVHHLRVERVAVDALLAELQAHFARPETPALWRVEVDLEFVPHPNSYHLFSNSNSKVAHWLRQLDCDVRGLTLIADWYLR